MSTRYLTPPELAKLWHVKQDRIREFIRRGLLDAVDLRSPGSRRPRFRISEEAIQSFELRRSATATARPRPQRRPRLPEVPEYV